jgi:rare lipoprotein A
MRYLIISLTLFCFFHAARAQVGAGGGDKKDSVVKSEPGLVTTNKKVKILYGEASYYAGKFHGRETYNGEIYDSTKLTAACNVLPMGTWIRVTNLSNNRSVIVKINDRMHIRITRVVDLSQAAASKLGYVKRGLTRVKVEVLEKK